MLYRPRELMRHVSVLQLLASLFLMVWCATAMAQQSDLLQAEEAFRFSVERGQDNRITLHWAIAEG